MTLLNVSVAILAGFAIFPAVFSFGLSPDAGPMLLFNVLPSVFHKMPLGIVFLLAFLLLFLFATLTSAFSMLEILVSSLSKGDPKKDRLSLGAGELRFSYSEFLQHYHTACFRMYRFLIYLFLMRRITLSAIF